MNNCRGIEQILAEQGVFVSTTVGVSMFPMLRSRRDTIVISPCSGRLKKYDVPLYKRGDDYILHRIIKVLPDSYVICGDNCTRKEYGITDDQIVGVLTGFYRAEKKVRMDGVLYQGYVRFWRLLYPSRCLYGRVRTLAGGLLRHFVTP